MDLKKFSGGFFDNIGKVFQDSQIDLGVFWLKKGHFRAFSAYFSVISAYINSFYSGKLIEYTVKEQFIDILPTIILSVLVGLTIFFLDQYINQTLQFSDLMRLILDSISYYILFLGFSFLMQLNAINDFKQLVFKR